jgi:hypothetical protein
VRVGAIRRIYPDLFRLSHPLAARDLRPMPTSVGPKLGRRVSSRYANTHKCSQFAIEHRAASRGVLGTSRVVWGCADVPQPVQQFLSCVMPKEGGTTHWDVMFGGARYSQVGLPPGNAVLGPVQGRPAWVVVYEFGGTYREDFWTVRKAEIMTGPYHHPRIAWMIYRLQGRAAWATEGFC